jgi:hypothetical protein
LIGIRRCARLVAEDDGMKRHAEQSLSQPIEAEGTLRVLKTVQGLGGNSLREVSGAGKQGRAEKRAVQADFHPRRLQRLGKAWGESEGESDSEQGTESA